MGLIDSQSTEIHDILANDQHTVTLGTLKISRQGPSLEQKITDVIHPDSEGRVPEFGGSSRTRARVTSSCPASGSGCGPRGMRSRSRGLPTMTN